MIVARLDHVRAAAQHFRQRSGRRRLFVIGFQFQIAIQALQSGSVVAQPSAGQAQVEPRRRVGRVLFG